MCRNIKQLHNFDPPATDDEVHAAALQYVRKISGTTKPSKANEAVFERAVREIAHISRHLLDDLVTTAPPRDREVEAARARAGPRSASAPPPPDGRVGRVARPGASAGARPCAARRSRRSVTGHEPAEPVLVVDDTRRTRGSRRRPAFGGSPRRDARRAADRGPALRRLRREPSRLRACPPAARWCLDAGDAGVLVAQVAQVRLRVDRAARDALERLLRRQLATERSRGSRAASRRARRTRPRSKRSSTPGSAACAASQICTLITLPSW